MYTTNSSFLSAPTGNPQAWADAIRPHNPAQAGAIAAAYFIYGAQIGINADLAIAQGCHESGWFTSAHWVTQFNPCGLGVTGPGVPGATFSGIDDGVKAHYEHLVCYTMAADPPVMQQWGMLDPRHFLHAGHPEISYLDGRWAVPGVGYSASIAAIANQVTGGVPPVSNVPTAADLGYPGKVHYASGSGEAMDIANVRWFIVHDTEGHFAGDEATLSGQISAHLLIDKSGEWRFMVPLDTVAYAAGNINVNRQSISVEQSGFADAHDGGYTDAQYRCMAAFFRFCVANGMTGVPATYIGKQDSDGGPEPDVPGILGHQDVPRDDGQPGWGGNYGHQDPGQTYDWAKLIAYIGNAPQPPAPPPSSTVVDGHDIGSGFFSLYQSVSTDNDARIRLFGLCVSDQYGGYLVYPANAAQKAKGLNEVVHPIVIVDFENLPLLWDHGRTAAPWDCRMPKQHEYIGVADDPVIDAIIKSMTIAGEPI